jgi:hypothetical protein
MHGLDRYHRLAAELSFREVQIWRILNKGVKLYMNSVEFCINQVEALQFGDINFCRHILSLRFSVFRKWGTCFGTFLPCSGPQLSSYMSTFIVKGINVLCIQFSAVDIFPCQLYIKLSNFYYNTGFKSKKYDSFFIKLYTILCIKYIIN